MFWACMFCVCSQDAVRVWTLQDCLTYAEENNIQIRQSRNDYLSGVEDTKEAKAALFPSLSATVDQSYVNNPAASGTNRNTYSGSYSLNAGMTVFQGGKLRTAVKMQNVQNQMDELALEEVAIDIRMAIVQAYMQCLYASEAIVINQSMTEAAKRQRDRAEEMWKAGAVSKVDFAQLESQYASNAYQVVVARSSYDNYKLQLKQLLELGVMDDMELAVPRITEDMVLQELPSKATLLDTAMQFMPEVKRAELAVTSAELGEKSARSSFFPAISLSAGIGSGHSTNAMVPENQLWNNLSENVGLTVSVPLFSNRKNRTAVNKARLALENSRLDQLNVEKELAQEVEAVYLDALSAQSQYAAAAEKEKYAQQSYELTSEQFSVGAANTVELITAQNELTAARQETLQAKYMAVMSMELLNIYQGKKLLL